MKGGDQPIKYLLICLSYAITFFFTNVVQGEVVQVYHTDALVQMSCINAHFSNAEWVSSIPDKQKVYLFSLFLFFLLCDNILILNIAFRFAAEIRNTYY